MRKAVFLDRDGTLNVEVEYLHEIEKIQILPGVVEALKILKRKGFLLIVISNQSGIGRGYFSAEDVNRVNEHMNRLLQKDGVKLDGFYYCPHIQADNCDCRKPKTKLYLQAARDFEIDLKKSYMVGDKVTDIIAADELGCGQGLVQTGHMIDAESKRVYKECLFNNLLEFARAI